MSSTARPRRIGVPRVDRPATVVIVCGDSEVASWPFEATWRPDLTAVDELCRLELAARRLGWSVRVRNAPSELRQLLELVGLDDVVGLCPEELVVEVGGEPEESEEVGIEKGMEPGDPPI
jgi:hypothetical protein